MVSPKIDEVNNAFLVGYEAIDEGDTFISGFNTHLMLLGYEFSRENPCVCPDAGSHGHWAWCRWAKPGA